MNQIRHLWCHIVEVCLQGTAHQEGVGQLSNVDAHDSKRVPATAENRSSTYSNYFQIGCPLIRGSMLDCRKKMLKLGYSINWKCSARGGTNWPGYAWRTSAEALLVSQETNPPQWWWLGCTPSHYLVLLPGNCTKCSECNIERGPCTQTHISYCLLPDKWSTCKS